MTSMAKVWTDEIDWGRTKCAQKERYHSFEEADLQVKVLQQTSQEPYAKARCLNAYQCKHCKYWHVGHDWSLMPRTLGS